MKKTIKFIMALTIMLSLSAYATLDTYDSFDYTLGEEIDGQSGGTGFAGNWSYAWGNMDSTSFKIGDGLSYTDTVNGPSLVVAGNSLVYNNVIGTGNMADIKRSLNNSFESYSEVWFSYLFKAAGVPMDCSRFAFNADQFNIGKIAAGGTTFGFDQTPTAVTITPGETYFIVTKIDASGSYFWVNPALISTEPAIGTADGTSANKPTGSEFKMFLAPYTDTFDVNYDEIRVGTTWCDVAPTVPEPAMGLVAILALALLKLRK